MDSDVKPPLPTSHHVAMDFSKPLPPVPGKLQKPLSPQSPRRALAFDTLDVPPPPPSAAHPVAAHSSPLRSSGGGSRGGSGRSSPAEPPAPTPPLLPPPVGSPLGSPMMARDGGSHHRRTGSSSSNKSSGSGRHSSSRSHRSSAAPPSPSPDVGTSPSPGPAPDAPASPSQQRRGSSRHSQSPSKHSVAARAPKSSSPSSSRRHHHHHHHRDHASGSSSGSPSSSPPPLQPEQSHSPKPQQEHHRTSSSTSSSKPLRKTSFGHGSNSSSAHAPSTSSPLARSAPAPLEEGEPLAPLDRASESWIAGGSRAVAFTDANAVADQLQLASIDAEEHLLHALLFLCDAIEAPLRAHAAPAASAHGLTTSPSSTSLRRARALSAGGDERPMALLAAATTNSALASPPPGARATPPPAPVVQPPPRVLVDIPPPPLPASQRSETCTDIGPPPLPTVDIGPPPIAPPAPAALPPMDVPPPPVVPTTDEIAPPPVDGGAPAAMLPPPALPSAEGAPQQQIAGDIPAPPAPAAEKGTEASVPAGEETLPQAAPTADALSQTNTERVPPPELAGAPAVIELQAGQGVPPVSSPQPDCAGALQPPPLSTTPPPAAVMAPPPPPPLPGSSTVVVQPPTVPLDLVNAMFEGIAGLREAVSYSHNRRREVAERNGGRAAAARTFATTFYDGAFFSAYSYMLEHHLSALMALDNALEQLPVLKKFFLYKRSCDECQCVRSYATIEQAFSDRIVWGVPFLSELMHAQSEVVNVHYSALRVLHHFNRSPREPINKDMTASQIAANKSALARFGDLVARSTLLGTEVEAYELVRGIAGPIPKATEPRAFVREGIAWLVVSKDPGISRDIPCRLVLFTDGMAVASHNTAAGASRLWTLVFWVSGAAILDVGSYLDPTSGTPGFRLRSMQNNLTFLVPTSEEQQQWLDSLSENEPPTVAAHASVPSSSLLPMMPGSRSSGLPSGIGGSTRTLRRSSVAQVSELRTSDRSSNHSGLSGVMSFGAPQQPLFGANLGLLLANLRIDLPDVCVPPFVSKAVQTLIAHGLREEGLFRLAGDHTVIGELRQKAASSLTTVPDLAPYGVEVVSSLLKTFIRELAEPVLTFDLYDDFLAVPNLPTDTQRVEALQTLISKLPEANRELLREISSLFYQVVSNKHINKMGFSNCAIVVAPNLMWKKQAAGQMPTVENVASVNDVVQLLLEQFMLLFEETQPSPNDPAIFRRKLVISASHSPVVAVLSPTSPSGATLSYSRAASDGESHRVWTADRAGTIAIWDAFAIHYLGALQIPGGGVNTMEIVRDSVWVAAEQGIFVIDAASPLKPTAPAMSLAVIGGEIPRAMYVVEGAVWVACETFVAIMTDVEPYKRIEIVVPVDNCSNESVLSCIAGDGAGNVWVGGKCGKNAVVFVYDVQTRQQRRCMQLPHPSVHSITGLGPTTWVRCGENSVCVIDSETYAILDTLRPPNLKDPLAEFAPPMARLMGQVWSAGSTNCVNIWDGSSGSFVGQLGGYHAGAISSLTLVGPPAHGGDARWHAWVGGADGTIDVWEIDAGWLSLGLPEKFTRSPRYSKQQKTQLQHKAAAKLVVEELGPRTKRDSTRIAAIEMARYEAEAAKEGTNVSSAIQQSQALHMSATGARKHNFKTSSIKTATACVHCHKALLGISRSGLTCSLCRTHVHRGCVKFISEDTCPGVKA